MPLSLGFVMEGGSSSSNLCLICNEERDECLINPTKKGLATILNFAKQRNDNHVIKITSDIESSNDSQTIDIHSSCRRNYTDYKRLKRHNESQFSKSPKKLCSFSERYRRHETCT